VSGDAQGFRPKSKALLLVAAAWQGLWRKTATPESGPAKREQAERNSYFVAGH